MKPFLAAAMLALAAGLAVIAPPSAASPLTTAAPPPGLLFVSPCGRPYRGPFGQPYPVDVWFNAADANKDGKLDKAEMRADADIFFRVLDQDHNGYIDGFEVSFYEHRILPEMLQNQTFGLLTAPGLKVLTQFGGPGQPDAPPVVDEGIQDRTRSHKKDEVDLQGAAPYNFLREPEPVSASDGDFNHRITQAEFAAASDRRFKALDRDGDGFLTLATLPRTHVQAELGRR
jgi:hypothetical protein